MMFFGAPLFQPLEERAVCADDGQDLVVAVVGEGEVPEATQVAQGHEHAAAGGVAAAGAEVKALQTRQLGQVPKNAFQPTIL